MSDQGVLLWYQEDDFILGMQSNACHSLLNQWRIPKLDPTGCPVKWPNLGSSKCHIYTSGGAAQLLRQHSPACCSPRAWSAQSLSLHLSPKWPSESYSRHCLLASHAETVPFECSSTFGTFSYMFSTSVGTYSTVPLQC